jgi:hypothetical protein
MTGWQEDFAGLADEYFPGSSQKIRRTEQPRPQAAVQIPLRIWDDRPRKGIVDGKAYEYFTIGHLAMALNRAPVTIRLWEQLGYIPLPERSDSEYADKRHRLYTRPQVEGIMRIAEEEGILHAKRPRIEQTRFAERVRKLFLELAQSDPLSGAVPLEEAA